MMKTDSLRLAVLTAIIITTIAGACILLMRSGEPAGQGDADRASATRAMTFTSPDRAPDRTQ